LSIFLQTLLKCEEHVAVGVAPVLLRQNPSGRLSGHLTLNSIIQAAPKMKEIQPGCPMGLGMGVEHALPACKIGKSVAA